MRPPSWKDAPHPLDSLSGGVKSSLTDDTAMAPMVNDPEASTNTKSGFALRIPVSPHEVSALSLSSNQTSSGTSYQPRSRRFMTLAAKSGHDLTTQTGLSTVGHEITSSTRDMGRQPPSPSLRTPSQVSLMSAPSLMSMSGGARMAPQSRRTSVNEVKETNVLARELDPTTGNKMINKYMVIRELGRGVHGKVKYCVDVETNAEVVSTFLVISALGNKTNFVFR